KGPFLYLPAAFMVMLLVGSWRRSLPFLFAFCVFLFQVFLYSISVTPIFTYRTLLPALIPFAAVAALQLASIPMRGVRILAISLFLCNVVLFAWEWTTHQAWQPVEGSPQIAQYLKSEWRENMPVIIYPDYEVLPVRYYFPELPAKTTILIKNRMDAAAMEQEFEKVPILNQEASHTIFLLIRIDLWQIKTADTFSRLLSVLKKERPRPLIIRALLVHSPFPDYGITQRQQNLLSELEKTFGRPILFEQNDLYVRSSYEWDAQ
ncbi:MAG TPA: hypothetical protein VJ521_10785, partial [Acidobacteriota bacterium]|nr:hypothetical protein [Acidobacteriota bacterium]